MSITIVVNDKVFTPKFMLTMSKYGGGAFTKTLVCVKNKFNYINNSNNKNYKNSSIENRTTFL